MAGLAEEEFAQPGWIVWARRGGIGLVLIAAVAGVVLLAMKLAQSGSTPPRQMARVTIVPDTPPPPPPPPPKEEKKEVQPKQEQVQAPKPVPQAPPDQPLKMEGPASDNGMAGVQAGPVTNDYAGQKIGGGGGGAPVAGRWEGYKLTLQAALQAALEKNAGLRSSSYRVVVKLWLSPNGSISKAELSDTTGNANMDERVRAALAQLPPFGERPPEGLPQPITMRLTARS